jgi:plastocyanin
MRRVGAWSTGVLVAAAIGWGVAVAEAGQVIISMKNREFTPQTVTVKAGEPVEWINDDQDVHQVISGKDLQDPSLGKPLDSGTLLPGQRFTFTFTEPGTYPYMCVIHWSLQSISGKGGMLGEVVVEP